MTHITGTLKNSLPDIGKNLYKANGTYMINRGGMKHDLREKKKEESERLFVKRKRKKKQKKKLVSHTVNRNLPLPTFLIPFHFSPEKNLMREENNNYKNSLYREKIVLLDLLPLSIKKKKFSRYINS